MFKPEKTPDQLPNKKTKPVSKRSMYCVPKGASNQKESALFPMSLLTHNTVRKQNLTTSVTLKAQKQQQMFLDGNTC